MKLNGRKKTIERRSSGDSRRTCNLFEQGWLLFQPLFRNFVIRAGALHFPPKPRRMIHFPQVHDLVNQNIISDEGWCLDEPPIQRNRPSGIWRPRTTTESLTTSDLVCFRIKSNSIRQVNELMDSLQ
jgi:hypothetical protein